LYSFFARYHRSYYGWPGAPVHDACAIAYLIDPTLIETCHCGVAIDTGSESRGRTNADRWGRAGWKPNCHVAVDIDAERFLKLLVQRISTLG
jgi:inosine-uridine nucleoside N-ribohydrolase